MIVKLRRRNPRYPDLTVATEYMVLGIEADDFRILNDRGQPYLYPRNLFSIVDPSEPDEWMSEYGENGERYAYPPPFNGVGFFEDFFDGRTKAVTAFWRVVNSRLASARGA